MYFFGISFCKQSLCGINVSLWRQIFFPTHSVDFVTLSSQVSQWNKSQNIRLHPWLQRNPCLWRQSGEVCVILWKKSSYRGQFFNTFERCVDVTFFKIRALYNRLCALSAFQIEGLWFEHLGGKGFRTCKEDRARTFSLV